MFVGKSIVYLDLQKTGSSIISKVLLSLPSEEGIKYSDHITLNQLPTEVRKNCIHKIKLGSIRNPWAWYVSLWAYGCQKKGALYQMNTSFTWKLFNKKRNLGFFSIPRKEWRRLYSDPHSKDNFKKWLEWTLLTQKKNQLLVYNRSPLTEVIGLYSFRYLRLYIQDFMSLQQDAFSKSVLLALDRDYNVLDAIIRQENLKEELLTFLDKQNIKLGNETSPLLEQKINTSQHLHYSNYYDEESIQWIKDMEWLIIDKYGYTFEN